MDKAEIIRRLEKISSHAVHTVGEEPLVMSLDDGIAVKEAIDLIKQQPDDETNLAFIKKKMHQQFDWDTGEQPSINEPDHTQRKEDDLARYQYLLMESHNMVDELLRNVGNSPCPRCSHYYAPDNNLLGTYLCDKFKTVTWDSQCRGFDEVKKDDQ